MTAQLFQMPVVMRPAFHDPAWREQHARERSALCAHLFGRPPRTRPLKVVDNDARRVAEIYAGIMHGVAAAIASDGVLA